MQKLIVPVFVPCRIQDGHVEPDIGELRRTYADQMAKGVKMLSQGQLAAWHNKTLEVAARFSVLNADLWDRETFAPDAMYEPQPG